MASDQEITLGKPITHENPTRDAIHIAIYPAVAAHSLIPGQCVSFWAKDNLELMGIVDYDDIDNPPVGIVDPFLSGKIKKGTRFWVFLFPNTITALRHVWTHPRFTEQSQTVREQLKTPPTEDLEALKKRAVMWIENFAEKMSITLVDLMSAADDYVRDGEYTRMDSEKYKDVWKEFPEFWKHYEVLRGPLNWDKTTYVDAPFTCCC
jgi:hypothetical protein